MHALGCLFVCANQVDALRPVRLLLLDLHPAGWCLIRLLSPEATCKSPKSPTVIKVFVNNHSFTMASTRFNAEHSQDADGVLAASLEDIPRYLFRVTHHDSQGTTTRTHVSSAAYGVEDFHLTDLYQIQPLETAADILHDHLMERYIAPPNADRPTRNLVSWTSSLLFALQCALYNHHRNRWRKTYNLGNIYILMVDTHQFQNGTFARDIQAIDFFRRFSNASNQEGFELLSRWRNGDDYYNGEYLSQGKLTIGPSAACRASMKELISRGLEDICPQLMEKRNWDSWAKRVRALRLDMSPVEDPKIPMVKTVAQAFDPSQVPIVIMLFSMSRHSGPEALEKYTRFIIEQYPRKFALLEGLSSSSTDDHD